MDFLLSGLTCSIDVSTFFLILQNYLYFLCFYLYLYKVGDIGYNTDALIYYKNYKLFLGQPAYRRHTVGIPYIL